MLENLSIDFFLAEEWSKKDIQKLQNIKAKILKEFIKISSENNNLSYDETNILIKINSNKSIASFLDIFTRANKYVLKNKVTTTITKTNQQKILNNPLFKKNLGDSLDLRYLIFKEILKINNISCPKLTQQKIRLYKSSDLKVKITKKEFFWRILNKLKKLTISKKAKHQAISKLSHKIGYLDIDTRILDIKGINFIKVPKINFKSKENKKQKIKFFYKYNKIFYNSLKHSFKNLKFFKINFNQELSDLLLIILLEKNCEIILNKKLISKFVNYYQKFYYKNKIQFLLHQNEWSNRIAPALAAIAAKRNGLTLLGMQNNGGGCIYERGYNLDWNGKASDPNNFSDYFFVWSDWAFKKNSYVNYIKNPSINLSYKKNLYKKKFCFNSIKKKKLNFLFSPTSLSSLFEIHCTYGLTSSKMYKHRQFINNFFLYLDNHLSNIEITIYIKLKGFGETIFENQEWMFYPFMNLKNIKIKYLKEGLSEDYFDYMDLHIIDGPSTSLANSINYNIPFITIWNKKIFKARKEYFSIFNQLKKNNLICEDKKLFIKIINKKYYYNFFYNKKLIAVKKIFCNFFVNTSDAFFDLFVKNINSMKKN
jgi:hypothetical protein